MRLLKQWQHVQLDSICTKIGSGSTPRGGDSVYVDTGTAIIRSQNVYNGKFSADGLAHIKEKHAEQLNGVTVETRDVLLNITGDSVARCCQVSEWVLPARVNQHVAIVRPDSSQLMPEFLCYYFVSPLMQKYLLSRAGSGGTRNALTKGMIESLEIPCPDLATQQSVVDLLRNYDDLIENNRRRIQLLEQAARLLYKEWFVHLRFPGHEHVKIKACPGHRSGDGVPEGWEKKKIADVCETIGGGTPSTKVSEYWNGDITWVVPSDITKNDCLALLDSERKITEKGLRKSSAKMVPAEAVLMTSRASVGFFALMDYEVCTNQGFINIIPHKDEMRMYLLFNLMSRVEEIRSNAKGTTYPEISKGRFRGMGVVVPPNILVKEFAEFASDIIRQVRILKRSTLKLERARDLLLPRLMNGSIPIP